jgi:putative addiction module component (TIGR02574 family)
MSASLASLEAEALTLSPEDRALLADHLLASLAAGRDVEDAWAVEVQRRVAEIEAGRMQLVPVEEAIARARQALA